MKQRSVRFALFVGSLWVSIPGLVILFAPLFTFFFTHRESFVRGAQPSGGELVMLLGSFLAGIALSWLWWSVNVPLWRLWAYRRVNDIDLLKRYAVLAYLVWPDGHPCGKTEIKSDRHRALEAEYERRKCRAEVGEEDSAV